MWPADIHSLLSLLLELQAELGLGIDDERRAAFQAQQIGGKSAQLKERLLACRTEPSAERQRALALALQSCIERAERWAGGGLAGE
jgi:hypothetical protein